MDLNPSDQCRRGCGEVGSAASPGSSDLSGGGDWNTLCHTEQKQGHMSRRPQTAACLSFVVKCEFDQLKDISQRTIKYLCITGYHCCLHTELKCLSGNVFENNCSYQTMQLFEWNSALFWLWLIFKCVVMGYSPNITIDMLLDCCLLWGWVYLGDSENIVFNAVSYLHYSRRDIVLKIIRGWNL